jgi:hypothetical protein
MSMLAVVLLSLVIIGWHRHGSAAARTAVEEREEAPLSAGGARQSRLAAVALALAANHQASQAACLECETQHCERALVGCDALAGDQKRSCEATVACIRASRCQVDDKVEPCYCGTKGLEECMAGAADGPCRRELEVSAGATSADAAERALAVAERFVNPLYAVGRAVNLVVCDHESCGAECRP